MQKNGILGAKTYTNPTSYTYILHPILHPKMPANTGYLGYGCRKCRIFSKNFFCGERKREGTHRPGSHKTSDFFGQKYGCFASKVRMFASKKSDVFEFPFLWDVSAFFLLPPPKKKFREKSYISYTIRRDDQ